MKYCQTKHCSVHSGNLILVNSEYKYQSPDVEGIDLVPVRSNGGVFDKCLLAKEAADQLNALMERIDGWKELVPVSSWRSLDEQTKIWNMSILENGDSYTRQFVALPGCSEHQTGLAIDLAHRSEHIDFICPDFPDYGICKMFCDKASDNGFILRYPKHKEAITGISYEPWHFRYVGIPHASIMKEYGFVLEEYVSFLKDNFRKDQPLDWIEREFRYCIYFLPEDADHQLDFVQTNKAISISGNNVNGWIITEQVAL